MKRLSFGLGVWMLSGSMAMAQAPQQHTVQDFENLAMLPKVWSVGISPDKAPVQLSTEQTQDGKQALKLSYSFKGEGEYLGVPLPVKILTPVSKMKFMLYGDNSGNGYGVYLTDSKGETHKFRDRAQWNLNFTGWKPVEFNLSDPHEIWGGDKNEKIDFPITQVTFEIGNDSKKAGDHNLYFDALSVVSDKSRLETLGGEVSVVSPAYGATIKDNTPISLSAPGFQKVTVSSWKAGDKYGSKATIVEKTLDKDGKGSFVFPAEQFPHGPITVTITGESGTYKDNCYLQLYNESGKAWNVGLPKAPPAAQGMKLVFADDFAGPLSIANDGSKTYYSHKPPRGWQDFSSLPFSDFESDRNPFAQVGSYLRIRADEKKNSSGLISSLKNDASGVKAALPAYFECRFLGPNAVGTWPAFWLMTDYMTETNAGKSDKEIPVDELDIIEAYGGEGPGSPNAYDKYMVVPHAWNQGETGKAVETEAFKALNQPTEMKKLGIPSTWFEAFHTYGCKITETDTIYYCDDIEIGRHKTMETSKKYPFFFMINLATGGGWPVNLSRYDGRADMYVDWVRVYAEK